jgi:NAD(P)-dependent dehydrogenase (short-subunit alcohol dehydrogenase family)
VALTRTLAAEPEASGINLQVLCPGRTATEILVVPGLEDPAALDRLAEAEGLLSAGNKPTLARRYTA